MCDLETSRMGAPYIYDISTLRVNVLWNNKFHYQVASCWLLLLIQVILHDKICMKKPNANNEDKQINKYVCCLVKCGECVLFGGKCELNK